MFLVNISVFVMCGVVTAWYYAALSAAIWPSMNEQCVALYFVAHRVSEILQSFEVATFIHVFGCRAAHCIHNSANDIHNQVWRVQAAWI